MKTVQSLCIIFLVAFTCTDCKKTDNTDPQSAACQPPITLLAQASCESGYPGVLLIASDYKGGSVTQFDYNIFVQKDTLSNDITTSSYRNASTDKILIAETVLKDAPKFVVQVSINCGTGKDYSSRYFSFVKRPAASPGCYVWGQQKL